MQPKENSQGQWDHVYFPMFKGNQVMQLNHYDRKHSTLRRKLVLDTLESRYAPGSLLTSLTQWAVLPASIAVLQEFSQPLESSGRSDAADAGHPLAIGEEAEYSEAGTPDPSAYRDSVTQYFGAAGSQQMAGDAGSVDVLPAVEIRAAGAENAPDSDSPASSHMVGDVYTGWDPNELASIQEGPGFSAAAAIMQASTGSAPLVMNAMPATPSAGYAMSGLLPPASTALSGPAGLGGGGTHEMAGKDGKAIAAPVGAGMLEAGVASAGEAAPAAVSDDPVDGGGGSTTSSIQYFTNTGYGDGVPFAASDDLWWFNGASPANYSTSITVELPLSWSLNDMYDHNWTLSGGSGIVTFSNGQQSMTTDGGTYGDTITLVAVGATPAGAGETVELKCFQNGDMMGDALLAVATPRTLQHTGDLHSPDATWGYNTEVSYRVIDQDGAVLPRRIEINEQWTTGINKDDGTTDWRRGPASGTTVNPNSWYDLIEGESAGHTPAPQNPQNPLGNHKVENWGQSWYIGSTTPGQGVEVQTDTLQKYQDHAVHTNVASPP